MTEISQIERRRQVLEYNLQGIAPSAIAKRMGIGYKTVCSDLEAVGAGCEAYYKMLEAEESMALVQQVFNFEEEQKKALAYLYSQRSIYQAMLVNNPNSERPSINPIAHNCIMDCNKLILEHFKLIGQSQGRYAPPPTFTQNNTTIQNQQNNSIVVNPEVEELRRTYKDAQAADQLIIDIQAAEAEQEDT